LSVPEESSREKPAKPLTKTRFESERTNTQAGWERPEMMVFFQVPFWFLRLVLTQLDGPRAKIR
jgi:hypothetical protein